VAWTSARAKRCGFAFDPAKLRTLYLAYEAKQGAADDAYARIEKAYDTPYRLTLEKISSDPNYCTEQKQRQIKGDLERHLIGDYSPNLPPPKVTTACNCSVADLTPRANPSTAINSGVKRKVSPNPGRIIVPLGWGSWRTEIPSRETIDARDDPIMSALIDRMDLRLNQCRFVPSSLSSVTIMLPTEQSMATNCFAQRLDGRSNPPVLLIVGTLLPPCGSGLKRWRRTHYGPVST